MIRKGKKGGKKKKGGKNGGGEGRKQGNPGVDKELISSHFLRFLYLLPLLFHGSGRGKGEEGKKEGGGGKGRGTSLVQLIKIK